jgi:hypothetical protein
MAITVIIGAIASAITYRMGGSDKYNPKWRDWGCSLLVLLALYVQGHQVNVYVYLVSFLLLWGALSSYWRWVNKTEDVEALNWFLHGLGIGLAMLPFFQYVHIWNILVRAVVLGITMMAWSEANDNAVKEELGRGALIILTLPILFL